MTEIEIARLICREFFHADLTPGELDLLAIGYLKGMYDAAKTDFEVTELHMFGDYEEGDEVTLGGESFVVVSAEWDGGMKRCGLVRTKC